MNVLACDIGGTRMRIGLVREGRVLGRTSLLAHSQQGLAPRLPALKAAWLQLLAETGLSPTDCAGISVAFPSLIDPLTGRILAAFGKYADASDLDLHAWAHAEFSLPLATLDYAAVFSHAAMGDDCAIRLRDHSLRVWSALAVNLVHAYDPDVLILGGGIMASVDAVLPAVHDYVHRHAQTPWGRVRVVASELGEDAGLLAAEWLLREQVPNLER